MCLLLLFETHIAVRQFSWPMVEMSLQLLFSNDGETVYQLMASSDIHQDFSQMMKALIAKPAARTVPPYRHRLRNVKVSCNHGSSPNFPAC